MLMLMLMLIKMMGDYDDDGNRSSGVDFQSAIRKPLPCGRRIKNPPHCPLTLSSSPLLSYILTFSLIIHHPSSIIH
jgi:hypothetical protein